MRKDCSAGSSLGLTPKQEEEEEDIEQVEEMIEEKVEEDDDEDEAYAITHRCKPNMISAFLLKSIVGHEKENERIQRIRDAGFGGLLKMSKIGSFPSCFLKWVMENFDPDGKHFRLGGDRILPVAKDDVYRVYSLPQGKRKIELKKGTKKARDQFRTELGMKEVKIGTVVPRKTFEKQMSQINDEDVWLKAAITYIIGIVLCPKNRDDITLKYADVLQDVNKIKEYDWCEHVFDNTCKGLVLKKKNKYPKVNFHFLLVNYFDRMGKNCRLATGMYNAPTCTNIPMLTFRKNLVYLNKVIGLGEAVRAGVRLVSTNEEDNLAKGKNIILMDPVNCPSKMLSVYRSYCEAKIKIMKHHLVVIEERMMREGLEIEPTEEEEERKSMMTRGKKRKIDPESCQKKKVKKVQKRADNGDSQTSSQSEPRRSQLMEIAKVLEMMATNGGMDKSVAEKKLKKEST